jgi:hypothetical protein
MFLFSKRAESLTTALKFEFLRAPARCAPRARQINQLIRQFEAAFRSRETTVRLLFPAEKKVLFHTDPEQNHLFSHQSIDRSIASLCKNCERETSK